MADSFQHKGIDIELTSYGEFMAVINGRNVHKPSLKAMKDAIDKAAKTAFEPFSVLIEKPWGFEKDKRIPGTELIRVQAISIEKSTAKWSKNKKAFVVKGQTNTRNMESQRVYRDSSEAIAAYKALREHEKETERIKAKREKEESILEAALAKFAVNPDDYAKK